MRISDWSSDVCSSDLLNATLVEIQAMVDENRAPIQAITTDGFGEFRRFITEARILVSSLSRVAQRLETVPGAWLFGNPAPDTRGRGNGREVGRGSGVHAGLNRGVGGS